MPESMGILHPGTSFGVFWSTNVARTWYRNEKYPLIPEKPGTRRGIPREGDSTGYIYSIFYADLI